MQWRGRKWKERKETGRNKLFHWPALIRSPREKGRGHRRKLIKMEIVKRELDTRLEKAET